MAQSILITQCLQNDFVKPIGKLDRLPNKLHIGYEETKRLMGENPAEGPVASVMRWAVAQPEERLSIIHIRDWHNPGDPAQAGHFAHFGAHCVAGTEGAEFAFAAPDGAGRKTVVVDSPTLNDFHGTALAGMLSSFEGLPVKVGVMGVWTEAKVTFLAYELGSRYPSFRIAVCSALTASSSTAMHFLALDQMAKLLGVEVYPSVGKFIEFLGGEALSAPSLKHASDRPEIEGLDDGSEADLGLIRHLFRDCRKVAIEPLTGGFSGSAALSARSVDILGHEQAPHVVKIGPRDAIGQERTAFERIEPVLGNSAPRVADFADMRERGAIKYRYATMGKDHSTTFKKLYCGGMDSAQTEKILETVFVEQLGRLYSAGTLEKCDLLDYYQFSPDRAVSVRKRVEALIGAPADGETLRFPNARSFPNLCLFYESSMPSLSNRRPDYAYHSYVHGDLNGANIVIDANGNVWLIDFFHTHRGHVLKDLIKLENDLLYIYTQIKSDADFDEALQVSDALASVTDLAAPLPKLAISSPSIHRSFQTLRKLRSFYPSLIRDNSDPLQWSVGAMRYAVHTLSFDESDAMQKKWALYTASLLGEKIRAGYQR
ncbi:MAG: isochorismatase family protein [Nitrospinae bacterium]|nr:isochorismatase family protein [Nitrospinota bacterium]